MELSDLQQLCRADGYARLRLGLGLYGWQAAVLKSRSLLHQGEEKPGGI